jgi:hypothetical protein
MESWQVCLSYSTQTQILLQHWVRQEVKVKSSLCLTKYHVMKTCGGDRGIGTFLTSVPNEGAFIPSRYEKLQKENFCNQMSDLS